MEIITRADAKAAGLKWYFTGKPCKHGHITERYVTGNCCGCGPGKHRRRAYDLKYRRGITIEQYDDCLAGQGFGCQCCGAEISSKKGESLHVDHHHGSGQSRGILCGRCNSMVVTALEAAMTPLAIWAAIKAMEQAGQPPSPWLVYLHSWNERLAAHKLFGSPKGKPEHFYLVGP